MSLRSRASDCKSTPFAFWDLSCVNQHPFVGFCICLDDSLAYNPSIAILFLGGIQKLAPEFNVLSNSQRPESRFVTLNGDLLVGLAVHCIAEFLMLVTFCGNSGEPMDLSRSTMVTMVTAVLEIHQVSPGSVWICFEDIHGNPWYPFRIRLVDRVKFCEFMAHLVSLFGHVPG